jgi:hypothetical protein
MINDHFSAKTESTNGEIVVENKDSEEPPQSETPNGEDDNNNTSIELLNKPSPTKESISNDPPVNLRLRITPSSTSPISLALNDSDNNNNTNEKASIDISNDNDPLETINDEDEPIEKIESVRNGQDGIFFQIKLFNENESQWVPAKVANRKYPQAVIAFWENHVEFT